MSKAAFDEQKAHPYYAVACFNGAWELIDKAYRTTDEEERLLQLAMASAWHWSQREDCQPQNLSISYWQISRIHAVCGRGDEALRYGNRCLDVSREDGVAPFAEAYAYEALARAEMVTGDRARMNAWLTKAHQAADTIPDEETRKALLADLETIR